MLCRDPYVSAGRAYACGACMPCRFNRRREWLHRIMLESALWEDNAFITLTYRDDALCYGPGGLPTLVPEDAQLWLKRLREKIEPLRVRYYLVGEYGDKSERPHYHVALFNYPTCEFGKSMYRFGNANCCKACDTVRDTWGFGNVELSGIGVESARYICRYVTKKMTRSDDARLFGRHPEFARMSLRPGIGRDAMHDVASELLRYGIVDKELDVPRSLRHGRQLLPLARYLRRNLRKMVGRDEKAPDGVLQAFDAEMLPLRLAARASSSQPSFKKALVAKGDQRVRQIEARNRIYQERREL